MADAPQRYDNGTSRAIVIANGVERLQQIYSVATNPATQTQITVPPVNVGLVRGFLVKVQGTIRNTDAAIALARTNFGAANLLKSIGFTDVNNTVRHATQGWHLNAINNAKQPILFGGSYAGNLPNDYGSNYDVMTCPATLAAVTDAEVQFYYYVPLSYSKVDLRGAMWAGIVNATAQLNLEINPNPVVDHAVTDPGLAVFSGAAGADGGWKSGTNVTVTVWQDYIDQIPLYGDGQPILPLDDLATLYSLNNTNVTGLVAGQDFGVPFANFRSFLSTCLVYDNASTYNNGTDINYFALQTANASNIWKYGPEEAALLARSTFMCDPPSGMYYFDHRIRPIATQQFGNTQITVNPSGVTAGASLWAGFEYFTPANQVMFAGSIPSG